MKTTIAIACALALLFAGCGDDDDAGGGGPQGELADQFIDAFNAFNTEGEFSLDEACVRDIVGELGDAEATEISENFDEPDFEGIDAVGEAIEDACFSAG